MYANKNSMYIAINSKLRVTVHIFAILMNISCPIGSVNVIVVEISHRESAILSVIS